MHDYRKLDVWKRAMALVIETYRNTEDLPASETYGLRTQVRRAAVSIPSNIAEGSSAATHKQFARYLRIAYGSACELDTQIRIAASLGWMPNNTASDVLDEAEGIRRMLHGLISRPA